MNRFIRAAAAVTACVAGLAVAGAPSAHAALNDNVCDTAESCVFVHWNYQGGMADMASTDSDWRNNWFSSGLNVNDQASSGLPVQRSGPLPSG